MKKLLSGFLFLVVLTATSAICAQPTFTKYLRGNNNQSIFISQVLGINDSTIFLTGSLQANNDMSSFYAARLNSDGDAIWSKVFETSDDDITMSLAVLPGEKLIMAGISYCIPCESQHLYILKTDFSGDTIWTRTVEGFTPVPGIRVINDATGGFMIAATVYDAPSDPIGFGLIRFDDDGNIIWSNSFNIPDDAVLTSAIQTSDDGFLLTGIKGDFGYPNEMYVVKVTSEGNFEWSKSFKSVNTFRGCDVIEIPGKQYLLAGACSFDQMYGTEKAILIKIDSSGDTLLTKYFSGFSAQRITAAGDGNYFLSGMNLSSGDYDYQVIKMNTDGGIISNRGYYFTENTNVQSSGQCAMLQDGGFIFSGTNYKDGIGIYNPLIRIDADGHTSCGEENISSPMGVFPVEVIVSIPDQQILELTSAMQPCLINNAGAMVTECFPTSVNDTVKENLSSLFPNPAQSQLTINVTTPADEVSLYVYDVQGRIQPCASRIDELGLANNIQLNIASLPDGFYVLQIMNNKTGLSEAIKFAKAD